VNDNVYTLVSTHLNVIALNEMVLVEQDDLAISRELLEAVNELIDGTLREVYIGERYYRLIINEYL
jgi:hypothetical protein